MPAFQYANNPSTTLSGAVTAVATSINVASAAGFPVTGKFTVVVGSEIMLVTGVVGTTWTVQRGSEGSVASAHSVGAVVTGVLTRASLFSARSTDVRSFGARGDGTTNDAAAIQAALDAASASGGGEVFVPDGTFMLGSGLSVPANTVIRGAGTASVLKLMAAVNAPVVTLAGTRAQVRDLKLDGNRPAQTIALLAKGVYMNADDTVVDNCVITSILAAGIHAQDRSKIVITNNDVSDVSYIAIFVNSVNANITDVLVANNRIDRTGEGVGVTEGGLKVRGTMGGEKSLTFARVLGNHVLMPVSPGADAAICIEVWGSAQYVTVSGNTTSGGSMGISLDSTVNGSVTGNTVYNFNLYGLELAASSNCTLGDNTVDGNSIGTKGIVLSNVGSILNVISGNTIRRCSERGIQINSGSNETVITGNTIYHTPAFTYAIDFLASYNCTVSGNVIHGGGTAQKGIMLDRSWNICISGNNIAGFTQEGILLFSTTADTFDWITITSNVIHQTGSGVATQFSGGAALGANVIITNNPL